ncbi:MAG: hypothetical protein U0794_07035 [Isosphaeraceae bacterium]
MPVVYDSVSKDTFLTSIDCLRPLGLMVSFGNASGKVAPFDIGILSQKGSLYLTRPTLATYTASRPDLEATARDVFDVIRSGQVRISIRHRYPLAHANRFIMTSKADEPPGRSSCCPEPGPSSFPRMRGVPGEATLAVYRAEGRKSG